MRIIRWLPLLGSLILAITLLAQSSKTAGWTILTGSNAWADSAKLKPGTARKITAGSLPSPMAATPSFAKMIPRPEGAWPQVPPGFKVDLYADNQGTLRQIRRAPNGDLFVTDRGGGGGRGKGNAAPGRLLIFRGVTADGKPQQVSTFTTGLNQPSGVAFYPVGANPEWVYVSNIDSVWRYPYRNGDLTARGASEVVIDGIPGAAGGHWTRDAVFSRDGKSLFVAVGSASNNNDPDANPNEFRRANILEYDPSGKFIGVFAYGIRNPVGIGIHPTTGELWTSINERDNLGDNLVPDYITHVQRGGFYGWPYYYIGGNPDPALKGAHPELKSKAIVPDVLIQAHSASLGLTFYTGDQFPAEYKNDLFAAEHGSWNRSIRAGHEVVRVPLDNGKASGVYQDFVTGFVTADGEPWGRPAGVEMAADGSLMITDDGTGSIWRVSYTGGNAKGK
jgi:glucose/arabinose dehydrogenase